MLNNIRGCSMVANCWLSVAEHVIVIWSCFRIIHVSATVLNIGIGCHQLPRCLVTNRLPREELDVVRDVIRCKL